MNLLRTTMHVGAWQVLALHLLSTICVAGFTAMVIVSDRADRAPLLAAGVFIAASFAVGIAVFSHRLGRWAKVLAELAKHSDGPILIPNSSRSTAADHGWNRLAAASRHWNALQELEQSVSNHLNQASGNSSLLLNALPDGVVQVDALGTIKHANAMMASLCGVTSPAVLVGHRLVTALGGDESLCEVLNAHPQLPQTVLEWKHQYQSQSGSCDRVLRGTRRLIESGSSGDASGFVWTIRDVTQQRMADAMRDQFLAAATHEFRTPLANIRAYAESLDMGHDIDAESRKRFYNVIQSESIRLSQLVDDLLDISRMQAGALVLEERETDLERLVREAATKVQGQMEERKLQFRCELPPKFPKAKVDKSKLIAALVNLLGNAAKYTPDGGRVTFHVAVNNDDIQFTVSDTGIGIAADELPKIFDRFFRSNDDRVRDISGSGLGLALVQEVARLHGGDLSVESELNKGSTFRLSIPLHSAA